MSDTYQNPLTERYASKKMLALFSPQRKFSTWRRLWIALAEAERGQGLDITEEQLAEMRAHADDVPFERAAELERELRHDVMAHVHAYGEQCPKARPILHLGATSCYVTDNADLAILRDALGLVRGRVLAVVRDLGRFAKRHAALPALAYTHLQPAQPTTVGRRACLWAQDLLSDLDDLEHVVGTLPFLGVKGTTGTQESFMKLFGGDGAKVDAVDRAVADHFGFERVLPVSGQTYPRKIDSRIVGVLAGIAQSAAKFAADMRILQAFREMFEPFGSKQIGSSAMPYKRNPMKAERISSLARHVMVGGLNTHWTAAGQWFERTLDDSANRRLVLPESFLAIDAILLLYGEIVAGIDVNEQVVRRRLQEEVPFLATEELMMAAVAAGGDRQSLHEQIRQHAVAARDRMLTEGAANDLFDRLAGDPAFASVHGLLDEMRDPARFIGRSEAQAIGFVEHSIDPVLARAEAAGQFADDAEGTRV